MSVDAATGLRPDLYERLAATNPFASRARKLFGRGQVIAVRGNEADLRVGYDARGNALEMEQVPIVSGYAPQVGDWVAIGYEAGQAGAPWVMGLSMGPDVSADGTGIGVFAVRTSDPAEAAASTIYFDESRGVWRGYDGTGWVDFSDSGHVTAHNALSGLQGGKASEYYHLTAAEYGGTWGHGLTATALADTGLTITRIPFASTGGLLADAAGLTWDGNYLTASSIKDSALTATRVTFAGASGLLTDDADLTFDGTNLSAAGYVWPTGTAGSVLFVGASGLLSQDNNDFYWDDANERLGIGGGAWAGGALPQVSLHVKKSTAHIWLQDTASGAAGITLGMSGLRLSAAGMNTTSQYTPGILFMSTDAQFTTENPKLLAGIWGRAAETYNADNTGAMAIDFATSPIQPGINNVPLVRMSLMHTGHLRYYQSWVVYAFTDDGTDTMALTLTGGGASRNTARGAYLTLFGNEEATIGGAGRVDLYSGDNKNVNISAGTGQVLVTGKTADGTMPGLGFGGDPNTGFNSAAADSIGFITGGVEQWRLIGTALYPITDNAETLGTSTLGIAAEYLSDANTTHPSAEGEVRANGDHKSFQGYMGGAEGTFMRRIGGQASVQAGDTLTGTAETQFASGSYTIPGALLVAGKRIRIVAKGYGALGIQGGAGTQYYKANLRIGGVGGTLVAQGGLTRNLATADKQWFGWQLEAELRFDVAGAPPSWVVIGKGEHSDGTLTDITAGAAQDNNAIGEWTLYDNLLGAVGGWEVSVSGVGQTPGAQSYIKLVFFDVIEIE